jgi:hypothetical protein
MNLNFMDNMGSMISGIVAIPLVIVALVFIYLALRGSRQAGVSKNWPATTGKIIASGIEPRRSHSGSGGTSTTYVPVVQYQYMIDGRTYMGNRITFGNQVGYGWTNMAQKQVDQYPPGANVAVFYDPNDPGMAVLERTGGASTKIYWGIAILMLVILAVSVAFTSGMNSFVSQLTSNLPR